MTLRISIYAAFKINVVRFLDVARIQAGAHPQGNDRNICESGITVLGT